MILLLQKNIKHFVIEWIKQYKTGSYEGFYCNKYSVLQYQSKNVQIIKYQAVNSKKIYCQDAYDLYLIHVSGSLIYNVIKTTQRRFIFKTLIIYI